MLDVGEVGVVDGVGQVAFVGKTYGGDARRAARAFGGFYSRSEGSATRRAIAVKKTGWRQCEVNATYLRPANCAAVACFGGSGGSSFRSSKPVSFLP